MLFADLDGFKHVNDTFGHHAGDEVLVSVARRLTSALRSSDSLARFGGDEFMMLLEDVDSEQELASAVSRVRAAVMDSPFVIDGQPQAIELTIGVVWADESHTLARGPDPGRRRRDVQREAARARRLRRL